MKLVVMVQRAEVKRLLRKGPAPRLGCEGTFVVLVEALSLQATLHRLQASLAVDAVRFCGTHADAV